MAKIGTIEVTVQVFDGVTRHEEKLRADFVLAAALWKREVVSISAGSFQALSPPTGAQYVIIKLGSSNISLTLKGVTGDTGNAMTPSSAVVAVPIVIPVNSASIGLTNGGGSTQTVEVIWL